MYDLVGEQRFLATTLANRLGQARFFVGKLPQDTTEDIVPLTEGPAYEAFETMRGKGNAFAQMVVRTGMNLFLPGDCYMLGTPPKTPPGQPEAPVDLSKGIDPFGVAEEVDPLEGIDIATLKWRMLSVSEITIDKNNGDIEVNQNGKEKWSADDVLLIRIWRPHPRYWSQADSPTRSSLPVLRELVGLTMHISAQVDSRLAGAGLLLVPASAEAAMRAAAGADGDDDASPFAEALMDAMSTAIDDRSSAAALVPLTVSVPDESIEKFKFMSFAGPLDKEARQLRDEAIRRLALGQDCPPELLLGVGGMNHWGAWLVREDVVNTHLEPPLALICDAITTQFLHLVLEQQGVEDFEDYVVWYDVDHMIVRPNRAEDAKYAKDAGLISDEASRDALGFDDSDAPKIQPRDPVVELMLEMLREAPSLAVNPGLDVLAAQVRALLDGVPVPPNPNNPTDAETDPSDPETGDEGSTEGGTPATAEDGPDGLVASAIVDAFERVPNGKEFIDGFIKKAEENQ